MAKLPKNVTAISVNYALEITVEQMTLILKKDIDRLMTKELKTLGALIEDLYEIDDVDYSGHLGAFIFYTVSVDDDKDGSIHSKVSDLVDWYLKEG
jgi:hypothetical protein